MNTKAPLCPTFNTVLKFADYSGALLAKNVIILTLIG